MLAANTLPASEWDMKPEVCPCEYPRDLASLTPEHRKGIET